MNYTEQIYERGKALQDEFQKAQKALSAVRLHATLLDAAQALVDVERPGETVTEIAISTNTAQKVSETLKEAEAELRRVRAELSLANAALQESLEKAQPEKDPEPERKTIYRIGYQCADGSAAVEGFLAYPRKLTYDTLAEAMDEVARLRNEGRNSYFVVQKNEA